jgi:RNA polymerase sigma factor (sigma-70 family)
MADRFNLDLSDLVVAIQSHEQERINDVLRDVVPILVDYLQVRVQASLPDAEDSVHTAIADIIERIREEGVRNEQVFYVYILRSVKHEYLKIIRKEKRYAKGGLENITLQHQAEQFDRILDDERQRLLRECLGQLNKESRTFIEYFMNHPELSNQEIADNLDLTHSNVRVKKMRIIRILHECYKRKSSR